MHSAIIIPARYASSRLPGKPLLKETGKYLIQHVYERAFDSSADCVIVATDDERIQRAVEEFGGRVAMTRSDHQSGTDRIAEVAKTIDAEFVVNLQGDEPLIDPAHLDLLIDMLGRSSHAEMATLAVPITSLAEWNDPNCVKVVCGANGEALYFSRAPIPYVRDAEPAFGSCQSTFLRHLGLYGYRRDFLLRYAASPPNPLEQLEKLEQLRALGMSVRIYVGIVDEPFGGVDTSEDYRRFVKCWRQMQSNRAA